MSYRKLRAMVVEEAYGLCASVHQSGEYRSDAIADGMRISDNLRSRGRDAELISSDGGVVVRLFLGDAPEESFEEAAYDLLEAASW